MASSWVDLATIFDPAPDQAPPAEWGDQIREDLQHIYERSERIIARTVLSVAGSSIASGTLPTVPNGFLLRLWLRLQNSAGAAAGWGVRFNGDSGANYSRQLLSGIDTTAGALENAGSSSFDGGTCSNSSVNRWSVSEVVVPDYLGSGHKSVLSRSYDPAVLTQQFMYHGGGIWSSTAAITSVTVVSLSGNFVAGSSLVVCATPIPV